MALAVFVPRYVNFMITGTTSTFLKYDDTKHGGKTVGTVDLLCTIAHNLR